MRGLRFPLAVLFMISLLALMVLANYSREIEIHQRHMRATQEAALSSQLMSYQRMFDVLYGNLFNRPEITELIAQANQADEAARRRLRGHLYRLLFPTFEDLQRNDTRELQFVLADGHSFLRFDRPDLYGDPIAKLRPMLAQVLEGTAQGAVLENGQVYPGYRFAFPLLREGKVVGAVDFCLSFAAVRHALSRVEGLSGIHNQFLVQKKLFRAASHPSAQTLFRDAEISPDFLVEARQGGGVVTDAIPAARLEWLHARLRDDDRVQAALRYGIPISQVLCENFSRSPCYVVQLRPETDSLKRIAGFILSYIPADGVRYLRSSHFTAFLLGSLLLAMTALALRRWLDSSRRLRTISDHMAEGMYVMDQAGVIIYANPTACDILGYRGQDLLGREAHELFHADGCGQEDQRHDCPIRSLTLGGEIYRSDDEQFRCRDGRFIRVSVVSSPFWSNKTLSGSVVLFRDITSEYEDKARLQRSDIAFSSLAEAVMVTGPDGTIQAINRAFTQITGYAEEAVIGLTPRILKSGRHDDAFYENLWQSIKQAGSWEGDLWNRRRSGEVYPEHLRIVAVRNSQAELTGYVATFSDITEKHQQEQALRRLAYHDPLTGLHNRAAFLEMFEHALGHAERRGSRLALLYLDLDRFKKINDTLGHVIGDRVLEEAAQRLRQAVRTDDEVARLGGDEFIIMLEDFAHLESPARVARKTLSLLSQPIEIERHLLHVTTSIGIAVYPDDGRDATSLLKNADAAMYMAKREGRNGFNYFTRAMAEKEEDRYSLEIDLHTALLNDEFLLYYQPKIDLRSGAITGLEALLRWQHPQRGLLNPAEFLAVAHDAGVMREITHWVITEACRQLQAWLDVGLHPGRIAINIDSHTLNSSDAYDQIGRTVLVSGVSPRLVELEIPESGFLEKRFDDDFWKQLVEMGFELSIDDFGIGESSLLRLKQLPVKTLKIDKSFVLDMESDDNDRTIIRTVVAMGQSLGVRVLAEGVETASQLQFLCKLGCDEAQGYLFARPQPAQHVPALLTHNPFAEWVVACQAVTEQD